MSTEQDLRQESLAYYESDLEAIEKILDGLREGALAGGCLLVDRNGHLVACNGLWKEGHDPDHLSALVAGTANAMLALGRSLGATTPQLHLRCEDGRGIHLVWVEGQAVLATAFDGATTESLVRIYSQEARSSLATLFVQIAARGAPSEKLDEAYIQSAKEALNYMLGAME